MALGLDWDPKYDNDGWSCCQEIFILPFDIGAVDGEVNEDGLHYTSFSPVYAPEDLSKYDYQSAKFADYIMETYSYMVLKMSQEEVS